MRWPIERWQADCIAPLPSHPSLETLREALDAKVLLAEVNRHSGLVELWHTATCDLVRADCARRFRLVTGLHPAQVPAAREELAGIGRGSGGTVEAILYRCRRQYENDPAALSP